MWIHRAVGIFFLLLSISPCALSTTFVVDSPTDAANSGDLNPGDGICEDVAAGTRCTIRAAIEEANANPVADIIEFALPFNITISNSALPNIVGILTIDARTVPTYNSAATDVIDAPPKIYLDGGGLAAIPSADGLKAAGFLVNIYALGIINFPDKGIDMDSPAGLQAKIDANWIGLDAAGNAAGNGTGIQLSGDSVLVGAMVQGGETPMGFKSKVTATPLPII